MDSFFYNVGQGFKNIRRNRMFSIASVLTMTTCLFLFGMFSAIYPAVVILGFNDEDAIDRNDQMVNLWTAFRRRYRYIVEYLVLVFREMVKFSRNYFFSDLSFGRNQTSEQKEQPDDNDYSNY